MKKFLKNWYPLILGIINGTTPYVLGYSIITWQWWAIAIPLCVIGVLACNKIFK